MASVEKDSKGYRVRFIGQNGTRKTVRLSGLNKTDAGKIARYIEDIASKKASGLSMDPQTANWLGNIGQDLHDKLSRAGLVEPRTVFTVREFLTKYIGTGERWKPATLILLNRTADNLNELFGDRPIQTITEADAGEFRAWLKADSGKGLGENTARRRCGHARQFFKAAVRERIIDRNPFADVSVAVGSASDKHRFITEAEAQAILEACPCQEWRMIFALARYGGLRCPSEVVALKWGDIDWHDGRISVPEPKVEHHAGRGRRIIPLFPELRAELEAGFELAPEGAVHVVNRYRSADQNMRTTFGKILDRAGVPRFERPFVNLRSSRATELRRRFDTKVVALWLGHSESIAEKHYVQIRPEDFAAAVQPVVGHQVGHRVGHNISETTQLGRTDKQATNENTRIFAGVCDRSSDCELDQWSQQDQKPDGKTLAKPQFPVSGGAQGGARAADTELQAVIDAWPMLGDATRQAILRAVKSDRGTR